MTTLRLAKDEVAYLAAYLGRLVSWDERSAVRLQARGGVVGIYGPSPMDVLAFVALPLVHPVEDPIDTTVSAGRLRDVIGDIARLAPETDVVIPDAVTGSASGLDPHISVANAELQAARVAAARGLTVEAVRQAVARHTSGRQWGFLGEKVVNVLELNLDLDRQG